MKRSLLLVPEPYHPYIMEAAYYIWLANGAVQNDPNTENHWLEGERQLQENWIHQHSKDEQPPVPDMSDIGTKI